MGQSYHNRFPNNGYHPCLPFCTVSQRESRPLNCCGASPLPLTCSRVSSPAHLCSGKLASLPTSAMRGEHDGHVRRVVTRDLAATALEILHWLQQWATLQAPNGLLTQRYPNCNAQSRQWRLTMSMGTHRRWTAADLSRQAAIGDNHCPEDMMNPCVLDFWKAF